MLAEYEEEEKLWLFWLWRICTRAAIISRLEWKVVARHFDLSIVFCQEPKLAALVFIIISTSYFVDQSIKQ